MFLSLMIRWVRSHPVRAAAVAGWYQQVAATTGSVLLIRYVLRLLGQQEAGLWFSFLGLAAAISLIDFGFSMAISRQTAHSLMRNDTGSALAGTDLIATRPGWDGVSDLYSASRIIFWRITGCAALVIMLLPMLVLPHTRLMSAASHVEVTWVWALLGASSLVSFQTGLSQSFLEGLGFMYLARFISGTFQFFGSLVSIAALICWPRLLVIAAVTLVISIVQFFAMHIALKRISGNKFEQQATSFARALIRPLWKVAVPYGFVNSGGYLVGAAQFPLVGAILGAATVAPYYLAVRISQTLNAGTMQITTSQIPFFTHECARGDFGAARHRMQRTAGLGVLLHFLAAAFLYLASPFIVRIWIGPGQYVSSLVLFLFSVNHFLGCAAVVFGHFVLGGGRNPFGWTTLIHGIFSIGGVFLFCPYLGLAGVPLSALLAGLCTNYWFVPFQGWKTWRSLNVHEIVSAEVHA